MLKSSRLIFLCYVILIIFFYCLLLLFGPSNSFIYWKFAVLVKEYGHWLALTAFAFVFFLAKAKLTHRRYLMPAYIILGACFLYPLTAAFYLEAEYVRALQKILPEREGEELNLVDFPTLLAGFEFKESPHLAMDFAHYGTKSLSLDFYPPIAKGRPAPWVLIVHAGGWDSGSSDQLPFVNSLLAHHGYGVVAINYRLAPQFAWPAQREDVFAAIEFIRKQAVKLNLAPDEWVIMGRSAGGQIAGVAAYTYEKAPPKGYITLYGPTDLIYSWNHSRPGDILEPLSLLRNFLGGTPLDKRESYVSASPLRLAKPISPPTLILHGQTDTLVYPQHSKRLEARLLELKVPVAYLNLPWGTHGFDYALSGPGGQIATRSILYFLSKVLPQQ